MTVAIIPARGGSKGIPLKNLQPVNDVSLLKRAIFSALGSGVFDHVFVSTDHDEIAQEALDSGASVLPRSAAFSGDEASTESTVLAHLQDDRLGGSDVLAIMQCTSPFISPESLREASRMLTSDLTLGSVFSARADHSFRWHPEENGGWAPSGHSREHRPRRQDLKPSVIETGGFYFLRTRLFAAKETRFCGKVGVVPVTMIESVEIDTPEDLKVANLLAVEWDRTQTKNANKQ